MAKIYNAQLCNCIEPKIDKVLRKNQNGFWRNRSTTSKILTICRILEGIHAKNLDATILFINFSKAFDFIQRGKMEQILLAYGLSKENYRSHNDAIKKHKSESLLTGWRHWLLWHCSRHATRRHISPIPLYHLPGLSA